MAQQGRIRVVLCDDHPLFRRGLRNTLEIDPQIEVVAELSSGEDAVERILELAPHIVLMDINLPGKNGLRITREVTMQNSGIYMIILTAYHDKEQLFHAIRAGASAYFPKDVDPETLLDAIHNVYEGKYVVNNQVMSEQQMAAWLLKQFEEMALYGTADEDAFVPLSPREMEILTLITKGYSNKEVAYHLGISRQTVKNHMTSILRKLQVNDRTQAAVYALRHGWIRLDEIDDEDER
nr:response regulator transcription factor [Ardenticatena sp.]